MRRLCATALLGLIAAWPASAQVPTPPALPTVPTPTITNAATPTTALSTPAPATPTPAPSGPTYTVTLKTRHACVVPHSRKLARADGGYIDVAQPTPQAILGTMTGSTAANSYLGCTGAAAEAFELVQDFEVACDDPKVHSVSLTLDAVLIGFVRSRGRAGAAMRLANVEVTSADFPDATLSQSFPPLVVEGTGGRLCNQHLPALEGPAMPLGRYTLTARFELDARASGVCDAHSLADFSPTTELPAEWVRRRDPFQGVSKAPFGFSFSLNAAQAHAVPAPPASSTTPPPPPPPLNLGQSASGPFVPRDTSVRQARQTPR